jgi:hypothetical protein
MLSSCARTVHCGSRRLPLAVCLLLTSLACTSALQQGFCANEAPRIVINAAAGTLDAKMGICKNFSRVRVAFPPSISTCDISESTVTTVSGIDGTFTITTEKTDGRLVAVLERSEGSLAPNHTGSDAATAFEFTLHNLKNVPYTEPPPPFNKKFQDFQSAISSHQEQRPIVPGGYWSWNMASSDSTVNCTGTGTFSILTPPPLAETWSETWKNTWLVDEAVVNWGRNCVHDGSAPPNFSLYCQVGTSASNVPTLTAKAEANGAEGCSEWATNGCIEKIVTSGCSDWAADGMHYKCCFANEYTNLE